jgi:hypothetical protein
MDMSALSAVKVNIIESCETEVSDTTYQTNCDEKGNNCITTPVTTYSTDTIDISWSCQFKKLPGQIGKKVTSDCTQSGSSGEGYHYRLADEMKQLKFKADLQLLERTESYTVDLCKGRDLKSRKIITLSQGLQGLPAENEFLVTIEIPGLNRPIKIKSANGILDQEIAICRDGDIRVTLNAVEKDVIWDDIYSCEGKSNEVVLNAKEKSKRIAKINFKRDNLWDKIMLDGVQQVKLEIREAPVK